MENNMEKSLLKLQGERLKEIRKIMGLSQTKFCGWLAEHGQLGNSQDEYSKKTVQAWEQGVRKVPDHIKKLLSDNVRVDGHLVQYAYLDGETSSITQRNDALLFLQQYTTDELLAELKRRIETP